MPKPLPPVLQLDEETERKDITDYEWSCQTIVAMSNLVSQNIQGRCFQGRPLRTSASNPVSPDTDVTPDVEIEAPIPPEAARYRAVNEIKADLPKNHDYWEQDLRQLRKYDDELSNWSRAFPNPHDIMLTTNDLRVRDVWDYIQSNGIRFNRKFSVLHSTRMEQKNTFINVRKDFGEISDPALDDVLSHGRGINAIHVVQDMNQMKFYDAKPPLIYTMMIIWDHVLKGFADFRQLWALRGRQTLPVQVTVEEVREMLTHFAPETNKSCIRREWVKDALDGFCGIGVASLVNQDQGRYEIHLKREEGVDWIFERIRKLEGVSPPPPSQTLDDFRKTDS